MGEGRSEMGAVEPVAVEVKGTGKQLFGGPPVPPGHVGIGFGFGMHAVDGGPAEVVRLVKPAHEMLDFLTRLHSATVAEMVDAGARARADAARGPLTPDAADRLLREGGFTPGTIRKGL